MDGVFADAEFALEMGLIPTLQDLRERNRQYVENACVQNRFAETIGVSTKEVGERSSARTRSCYCKALSQRSVRKDIIRNIYQYNLMGHTVKGTYK